jgi:hypothetical protein
LWTRKHRSSPKEEGQVWERSFRRRVPCVGKWRMDVGRDLIRNPAVA